MGRWWVGPAAGVLALSAILGSCSAGDDRRAQAKGSAASAQTEDDGNARRTFSRAEADTFAAVTAPGFQFVGLPPTVKGPKVLFELKNESGMPHDLEVVRTPDGKRMGYLEPLDPGKSGRLALELPAGRYIAWCNVKLIDTPHADIGMLNEFTVE